MAGIKRKTTKPVHSSDREDDKADIQALKEKYGVSHQAVSGAMRATRSSSRQMLEEYLSKKRARLTRTRFGLVKNVR